MNSELLGAGLSCGFAVVAGIGIVAGAAAEVPTVGTSTALIVISWVGFATSAVQCVNGVVRSVEALQNPDSNSLQDWDNNRIYSTSMLVVDAIGVATAIASLPSGMRNLLAVLERRGGLPAVRAIQGLSRAERPAAMRQAIAQAVRTPEGRQELEAALRRAGLTARQAAQTIAYGANTNRRVSQTIRAISQVTASRLNTHLLAAMSGGLSPLISGTPAAWTGPASGSVNALLVHIVNLGASERPQVEEGLTDDADAVYLGM